MSGLGIAFPLEAAAPLVRVAINSAPHVVRPALLTGLGLAFALLCGLCLSPLAGLLGRTAERSLTLLRKS